MTDVAHALQRAVSRVYTGHILYRVYRAHREHFAANWQAMPWKECDVREERFRFIEDWRSDDFSMAELCRHYEVTRATGYKWVERYGDGGLVGRQP